MKEKQGEKVPVNYKERRQEREQSITIAWDFLHEGLLGGYIYWAVQTGTEQGGANIILIQCHHKRQDFAFVCI